MTPPYAVKGLMDFIEIPDGMKVWEPAAGAGDLVKGLVDYGVDREQILTSELEQGHDFFLDSTMGYLGITANAVSGEPGQISIITNPPYSIKKDWIERCISIGVDWALLLPVESIGTPGLRELYQLSRCGDVSVIFFDTRVDFKMPDKKWCESAAQFPTCWIVSGFGLESGKMYDSTIKDDKKNFADIVKALDM